ncbi:transcriptional regulator [Thalassotalea insulae]|uniref:Transcriptional regulator n=2 Tax=Thalassotalea insulae TaxID=2056778 RepID=A0ABQ6GQ09_9GAMM|nr:transcriptional regulator [Thalassotalea insulae]
MDWNGLKTFIKVVETGSLAAAAKELGVNHSTVFRRLRGLEQDVGAKLLAQQANRYHLTAIGEEFAALGRDIDAKYNDIERLIVGKEYQPKGHVRITAPFNIANRFIPQALKALRKAYPEITVELLASNQEVNMNTRNADIAVRATQTPPGHLVGRKVTSFAWGLFAGKEYLNSQSFQTVSDLKHHNVIGAAGQMCHLPAFNWLEQHYSGQITIRCDELITMSHFAETGQGIALLPMDQLRDNIECVMLVPDIPASELWLLTHPDLKNVERIRVVMKFLTEYFSGLTEMVN